MQSFTCEREPRIFSSHVRSRAPYQGVFHSVCRRALLLPSVADLGFGKGGCPIHQKGAPEGRSPRHARRRRAPAGGRGPPRHSLIHFPGISGRYKLYDSVWFYDMSGVDFAGDTISIVHRDRKVEVAPNWATLYFQNGHPKQRASVRTPCTPPGSAPAAGSACGC